MLHRLCVHVAVPVQVRFPLIFSSGYMLRHEAQHAAAASAGCSRRSLYLHLLCACFLVCVMVGQAWLAPCCLSRAGHAASMIWHGTAQHSVRQVATFESKSYRVVLLTGLCVSGTRRFWPCLVSLMYRTCYCYT